MRNNEDAGDLMLSLAAEGSEAQSERTQERRVRAWEAYRLLWKKWKANTKQPECYPTDEPTSCEACGGPMGPNNCHAGAYSWHCGCDA